MTIRLIAALAAGLVPFAAGAVVVVTDTTQLDTAFTVSGADLLQTALARVDATGGFSREGEVGLAALTDGSFGPVGSVISGNANLAAATADATNTITYALDGAYNLSSIATYAGWDAYRGGQSYTVSYATAAAPTTFVTLASEYNNAQGGGDVNTRAVITRSSGLLAGDVTAIRFVFNGDLTYGYAGYREIDVVGAAVPEPAMWALFVAGFGLVGSAVRRRGIAAA